MYLSISIEKSGAGLPAKVGIFKASGLETFSFMESGCLQGSLFEVFQYVLIGD